MTYRNKKLLDAARDRPCVICGKVGTTVACHSTRTDHGHGTGCKSPDYYVAYLCQWHHDLIDGRRGEMRKEERRDVWLNAFAKTVALWFTEGIVTTKKEV